MSDATCPPDGADRNLLFGVLALQLDFISRPDLQRAIQIWGGDRTRPLAQVLVDRQLLAPRRRAMLEELVREHLALHGMDLAVSLKAACAACQLPTDLNALVGPALRGGLATLATPPSTLGGAADAIPPPPPSTSERRFRVLRPHARGALGEVFVAHDEELHREVALKEIQGPYAGHPDSRARFLLEAEITGSLEHPGIVPVYSLGRYADGRPFYAMRFIRGESLHDAINRFHQADTPDRDPSERALSLRGLLTRFVGVCNAIAYAHSRGVIHRDIKPANVMLGDYGETLVVDWGLAKAFDQPMTTDSVELPIHPTSAGSTQATMLGQAVGTPAYMPPEQAEGRVDKIGPPSDIYSLGATLFQLLTGQLAFGGSATEVIRQVKLHQFPAPRKVNRLVPKPLEAVVLKAMAFRPEDRYASVSELANEVERYLADEPVLAHRESVVELAQRWTRHHRPYVYAAAALLLTALVGLGVGLWAVNQEQRRTKQERDNAQDNLDLAKKAVDECFLVAKDVPLLQEERMREVRKLLLEKARPFYENFRILNPDDAAILFEVGKNRFRVGYITEAIGRKDEAVEHYTKAREVFKALADRNPANDGLKADLGRTSNNLGVLRLNLGERDKAKELLEEARKLREDVLAKRAGDPEALSDVGESCNNLGVLYRLMKTPREALERFEKAREVYQGLADAKPDEDRHRADLGTTLHNLAQLRDEEGQPEEALKCYEEALAIREALRAKVPASARYRADLASTLLNLAAMLHSDEPAKARGYDERAKELCEGLVKEDGKVAEYRDNLGRAYKNLGVALLQDGKALEALALHHKARAIFEELAKQDPVLEYRVALAATYVNVGRAMLDAGANADGMAWFDRSHQMLIELGKKGAEERELRPILCRVYWGRADALGNLTQHAKALPEWEQALQLTDPASDDRLLIRKGYAFALAKAGEHRKAIKEVAALESSKDWKGELSYELACVCSLAAKAAAGQKQPAAAEEAAVKAVEFLERAKLRKFFAGPGRVKHLQEDPDLDFVRRRADYARFAAGL